VIALFVPTTMPLQPAGSRSAASLALTAATTIPLDPAVSESSASMTLWTRAARILQALRVSPRQAAAAVHPHAWHMPESAVDAPLLLLAACAAVLWRALRRLR
jgi:hypothetical protein